MGRIQTELVCRYVLGMVKRIRDRSSGGSVSLADDMCANVVQ